MARRDWEGTTSNKGLQDGVDQWTFSHRSCAATGFQGSFTGGLSP